MKTCLKCKTTTRNDELQKCNVCGAEEFRKGRPATGFKMEEDVLNKKEDSAENDGNDDWDSITEFEQNQQAEQTGQMNQQASGNWQPTGNQQAPYQPNYRDIQPMEEEMSIGKWFLTFILMGIPIVSIVYAIVKITGKKESKTMHNYFLTSLIMMAISFVLSITFTTLLAGIINEIMYSMY